ncbi:MAG: DNA-methyltransferase [Candidatus Ranarchaeia archaeon]
MISDPIVFKKQTIFCRSSENMEEVKTNSIDVIITSPPYNVGKLYSVKEPNSDLRTEKTYLEFLSRIFSECFRVLKPSGVFYLNIGDSAKDQGKSEKVVQTAVKTGFKRLQTIIWIKSIFGKGHYTPSGKNRRLNNLWENIYVLIKSRNYEIQPREIGIPYSDKSNIGRYSEKDLRDAGDIWFIPYQVTTGKTKKKNHPAPFPIELPLQCIKLTKNVTTVLDPFAGTGTTLAAAQQLGKKGIGYETNPDKNVIIEKIQTKKINKEKPLLPQMENYIKTTTKILKQIQKNKPETITKILQKLSKKEQKNFENAIKDLKIDIRMK